MVGSTDLRSQGVHPLSLRGPPRRRPRTPAARAPLPLFEMEGWFPSRTAALLGNVAHVRAGGAAVHGRTGEPSVRYGRTPFGVLRRYCTVAGPGCQEIEIRLGRPMARGGGVPDGCQRTRKGPCRPHSPRPSEVSRSRRSGLRGEEGARRWAGAAAARRKESPRAGVPPGRGGARRALAATPSDLSAHLSRRGARPWSAAGDPCDW